MITYRSQIIPVFSIRPNWNKAFSVAEDFGGKAIEALSTAEQRIGTQPRGLWELSFNTLTLSAQETGYIRKILETPEAIPFAVPFWPNRVKLTADAVIGNAFVYCDPTAGTCFDLIRHAILWKAFNVFETFNTFTVGTDGVQFAEAIGQQFDAGDDLVPLLIGHIKRPKADALTDTNGVFKLEFREQFLNEENFTAEEIEGDAQYEQREVVEFGIGGPLL